MKDREDREDREDRPEPAHPFEELFRGPLDIRSVALTGIFILALLYTFYFARVFLLPVVLALLLSFLLAPVVRSLKRIWIPEALGAGLVLLVFMAAIGIGGYELSGPAAAWIEKVPQGARQIERRVRELQRPVEDVRQAAEEVEQQVARMSGTDDVREVQVQGRSFSGALLSQTQAFLAGAVIMLVLLYFLLASGDLFLRKLVRVLPRLKDKKAAIEIARATESHISTYLVTVTLINIGLGILVGVAMSLAGMPNPILWGVTAGVLNFIPYLGPIAMLAVLTVASFLTFPELDQAIVPPLIFAGLNIAEGYLVTPALLSRRLMLNPVVIFLGLIFWGWLWGIAGALLAVPILSTFKIFCDHIEPLSPIGEFLGR